MTTLIVGYLGNMGRRYGAILDYLGEPWMGCDQAQLTENYDKDEYDRAIIATPTARHIACLEIERDVPVLCEKPVVKTAADLARLEAVNRRRKNPISVVNQYKHMRLGQRHGRGTYYDYFKHGYDGLAWDCSNLIGLSQDDVVLRETSPIWRCALNGVPLGIEDMDYAYIRMIQNWLREPASDLVYIVQTYDKVQKWLSNF